MSKIKLLSKEIIPKIAAGEVIQRPSSVVKELVENAVDAGAKNIIVEVEDAGLSKIKIIDDGLGMSEEDLKQCFLSHTTSKISSLEDLSLVNTYGFRGEALHSICAMADVSIKSAEAGSYSGNVVAIEDAKFKSVKKDALAIGTMIEVTNLFARFPARKKFLKSNLHENQDILNVLIAYGLAHDDLGLEFYRDGKQVFKLLSSDTLIQRAEKVLGTDFAGNLLSVNYDNNYLKISGYISKPQLGAQNRNSQFLFVNTRYVDDLVLAKTVKEAYKNLLDAKSYPPYILNLTLNPGLVDVNVHPQKEKVRFWNDATVYSAVFEAVAQSLKDNDLTFTSYSYDLDKKAVKHLYHALKDAEPVWDLQADNKESFEYAFQIGRTYIAYPDSQGLVLIDQHAAHESILFEQFLASFRQKMGEQAQHYFKDPIVFTIPLNLIDIFNANKTLLEKCGFILEDFGKDIVKVLAVPSILKDHDPVYLLTHALTDLASGTANIISVHKIDDKTLKTLAYLSCRSAVKAGDKLDSEEIQKLLYKLADCKEIYTCPHGRPVKTKISLREMAKLFKRI